VQHAQSAFDELWQEHLLVVSACVQERRASLACSVSTNHHVFQESLFPPAIHL
jgi:hypothetical protein